MKSVESARIPGVRIPSPPLNFAPVDREQALQQLEVTGELPRDLTGRLLRDGPNPAKPPAATDHWFVGDGMLHAIEFRDAKAL